MGSCHPELNHLIGMLFFPPSTREFEPFLDEGTMGAFNFSRADRDKKHDAGHRKYRPPVLSQKTEKALSEYLAFRQVLRNIYGFEIDSEKLSGLVQKVEKTYQEVKNDLNRSLHFLREMSS